MTDSELEGVGTASEKIGSHTGNGTYYAHTCTPTHIGIHIIL